MKKSEDKISIFKLNGMEVKAMVGNTYIPNVPPHIRIEITPSKCKMWTHDVEIVESTIKRIMENEQLRLAIERTHKFYLENNNGQMAGVTYQILQEAKIIVS